MVTPPAVIVPATPPPVVVGPNAGPDVTEEQHESHAALEPWTLRPGAFLQAQWRTRQNSPAPFDEDGFRLARARITATGAGTAGNLVLSSYFEAELQPTFSLYDAYVSVSKPLPNNGVLTLDVGQMRVPISRQQLISDTRRAWIDSAQITSIAPDRDLGARAWYVPSQLPQVRVIGGMFNGEGRNQVQNINESYLYAGRLEITPIGKVQPYEESSFAGKWLSLGLSIGRNLLTPGDYHEKQLSLGADLSGSWRGWSGSIEYLEVRHYFDGDPTKLPDPNYHANGWVAQVNYMLPVRLSLFGGSRIEIGARVEEIDRNDTVPIEQIADPNQSQRIYTAVVSYYMRKHLMKAQLAAYHYTEIEDKTATGADATYPSDQILLQVTYRVE